MVDKQSICNNYNLTMPTSIPINSIDEKLYELCNRLLSESSRVKILTQTSSDLKSVNSIHRN